MLLIAILRWVILLESQFCFSFWIDRFDLFWYTARGPSRLGWAVSQMCCDGLDFSCIATLSPKIFVSSWSLGRSSSDKPKRFNTCSHEDFFEDIFERVYRSFMNSIKPKGLNSASSKVRLYLASSIFANYCEKCWQRLGRVRLHRHRFLEVDNHLAAYVEIFKTMQLILTIFVYIF